MAQGLIDLTNSQVSTVGEFRGGGTPAELEIVSFTDCGWSTTRQRKGWYQHLMEEEGFRHLTTFQRCAAIRRPLVTRSRSQLISDREWESSIEFNQLHKPLGLADLLGCMTWLGDPPAVFAVSLHRPSGVAYFGNREQRLVHLFADELRGHLGRSLVRRPGELTAGLSPRLRQTLECLMTGDSEKQVALRLGLSRHTVHEYVSALYRRLGVNSRAELMALCLWHCQQPGDFHKREHR
jgi:DNA-binding CsgD family transcriptional regulator